MRRLVLVCLCLTAASAGAETLTETAARLDREYRESFVRHVAGPEKLPFTVEARREHGMVFSKSQFLLEDAPFLALLDVLGTARGWCESLLLHLNVKTCVFHTRDRDHLELYLGRKYYQHPSESVRIVFEFAGETSGGALRTTLTADAGPYGTSKYEFVMTAIEVDEGVFIELRLTNAEGYAGTVVDLYLNTLARHKVGFTRVGETLFGNPKYITGQEAAAERNVVRYMYALKVTLELGDAPFARRAEAWFDATEQHARQLHELERGRYLEIKGREYRNQATYQEAADRGETVEVETPSRNR